MTLMGASDLECFAAELLTAGGFKAEHAADTARVLVWADARGTASHGVLRIPRYVEMVREGRINPDGELVTEINTGVVRVLNANSMPGATAMSSAVAHAMKTARDGGLGWCSVKNITHAGAIGFYAQQASDNNMIAIVLSASGPLMAYHGARVAGLSTNPVSISVPAGNEPLLLDMSTSTVALGKILHARDAKSPVPADWGLDENGAPTTDPGAVKTLTPLGGPKGSGLSLMIEVLASVLVANPVISEALNGRKAAMNGAALVLDVARFTDQHVFAEQVRELVASIRALPPAQEAKSILMPGERGFALSRQRLSNGIPVAVGTMERLRNLAANLGVPEPSTIQN